MPITSATPQTPIKLDLYDKKIIFFLSQDSRMQRKTLAHRLRISEPRLLYKIARLEQEILSPAPNINFPALDIPSYIIFTQELSPKTRERLLQTSSFWFFKQAIGKYQYVMNVITDDIASFCSEHLAENHFEIHPIIRYLPDNYDPWDLNLPANQPRNGGDVSLDAKDYRLLVRLSTHTTESLSQLSNATHLDRKTIKQRIDKLYAGNIIQKFRYGINIFKIGHLVYLLKLDVLWGEKQQLLPHLRADNYAGFIFETLTGYVMYYMPPSHKELFLFTSKIQSLSPSTHVDVIQTTDIFRIELVPQSAIRIFQQRAGLRQATSSSRRGARGSHAASRNHRTP